MVWITHGQGAICDGCGKPIPHDEAQYEVITKGREMHLDRECFRRRMDELT